MSICGKVIEEMIGYYAGDVKRIQHFMKVYGFAKTIGEQEKIPKAKQEILEIAAIVHDIGIKISEEKYHSSAGRYQEIEGPAEAEKLLLNLELDENLIGRVSFLVGHHHTYQDIDDLDYQILIEADFLVNIAEDDMKPESISKIKDSYFKTKTGILFLENMYGSK